MDLLKNLNAGPKEAAAEALGGIMSGGVKSWPAILDVLKKANWPVRRPYC